MNVTVFKSYQLGIAKPIANVRYEAGELSISSDDKQVLNIIKKIIHLPVRIREKSGNRVNKRKPANVEEHVFQALKDKLFSPYWLGPKHMILESPKYSEKMGTLEVEALLAHEEESVSAV